MGISTPAGRAHCEVSAENLKDFCSLDFESRTSHASLPRYVSYSEAYSGNLDCSTEWICRTAEKRLREFSTLTFPARLGCAFPTIVDDGFGRGLACRGCPVALA